VVRKRVSRQKNTIKPKKSKTFSAKPDNAAQNVALTTEMTKDHSEESVFLSLRNLFKLEYSIHDFAKHIVNTH